MVGEGFIAGGCTLATSMDGGAQDVDEGLEAPET